MLAPMKIGTTCALVGLLLFGALLGAGRALDGPGLGAGRALDGRTGGASVARPAAGPGRVAGGPAERARLVSLNPSLTAIVLRLGGEGVLVGVDDYSADMLEAVADRPRVGGLFAPSLESVLALRPDRVLMVAGVDQERFGERLARRGVAVEVFDNERFDEVLENIERIGGLLGRSGAAADRVRAIEAMRSAVAEATATREAPATVVVLDRSPLYVVGAETFLDEMLSAVGGRNLAGALGPGYPRASIEWLIAARPELLIDLTPRTADAGADAAFWSRWPSLPAVAADRVLAVDARRISLPGPDLDHSLRALAIAVHGEEIGAAIEAALARRADRAAESSRSGASNP
jgi:ABC-type Fe3+-hydroxamate transport system substrate-binding protein